MPYLNIEEMTDGHKNIMDMDTVADMELDIVAGGWLIVPKLFRPKAYLACASSKLCQFIRAGSTFDLPVRPLQQQFIVYC